MEIRALEGELFQSVPGFEAELAHELGPHAEKHGPLFLLSEPFAAPVFWWQNRWSNLQHIAFSSIGEAAGALRSLGRNWTPAPFVNFRRTALIAEKLSSLPRRPRSFPWLVPDTPMGAFTLLDDSTLLASQQTQSPFPGGAIAFVEDKEGPPSRAYLKLWESLCRMRRFPSRLSRCFDAGASPGGWTWALARLGAQVLAVDRAPLDAHIAALPGVRFLKHDAFTLRPEDEGPFDWVFCDVAAYPSRLCAFVERWLASGQCGNFVCTIKFQGPPDSQAAREGMAVAHTLAAIAGSQVVHLYHNKHELTWLHSEECSPSVCAVDHAGADCSVG